MKATRKENKNFIAGLRRSDRIILGIITVLIVLTVVLNILQRCGLSLINESIMLFLPVLTLFALIGWGIYALLRRVRSRVVKIAAGVCVGIVLLIVLTAGSAYLSFMAYTALPHSYKTLTDPAGGHRLVVMWQFDSDADQNEANIEARKSARLAAYPDSDAETIADDVSVLFRAYPTVLGLFYRSGAEVEGEVRLAYTGNIAPFSVIEPAQTVAEGETVEPTVIDTPHGTMMLEWLDDNATAHFYVVDPGVAEGGECFVRFGK